MKRLHHPGAMWHVIARGARRLLLFRDDADRAAFLRILAKSAEDHRLPLHSYVLMDNHYHLLMTGDWKQLGACMHEVNRQYSRGNNAKYELKGHAFEGSYLSFVQRSAFWKVRTSRYIDFNPVRAGLVRAPEQYRWSSCRAYVRGDPSPIPLDTKPILSAAGGREAYRAFEPPTSRREQGRKITAMDLWIEQVAWLLHHAEEQRNDLEGESPRTVAVAWARRAGIPPRAIAKALGYASGHSVSVLLDSTRKRAEGRPKLGRVLDRPEI